MAFWRKKKSTIPEAMTAEKNSVLPAVTSDRSSAAAVAPSTNSVRQKKNFRTTAASWNVLVAPVVSEKSVRLGVERKVVFQVARKATKSAIKRAVQEVYGVTPVAVNTKTKPQSAKQRGRTVVRKNAIKHAVVTLKEGDTIDVTKVPTL